jgi:hypothetical protein
MAIRTVVTRGYGNGTFNGTIALVVTRGYAIGIAVAFETILSNLAYVLHFDLLADARHVDPRSIVPFEDQIADG